MAQCLLRRRASSCYYLFLWWGGVPPTLRPIPDISRERRSGSGPHWEPQQLPVAATSASHPNPCYKRDMPIGRVADVRPSVNGGAPVAVACGFGLELGDRCEDAKNELPHARGRIDRTLLHTPEPNLLR